MKKFRNQDIASIIAIFALFCHVCTFPITGKCAVLRTRLSLMQNEHTPPENQINQTKSELRFYKLTSRILESAAFLIAIISVIFCYRSFKAGEPGALVAFCVLLVIFLLVATIN